MALKMFFFTFLQKFQEIEEMHLKQMREFLTTYIELLQNNHDMVGQVSCFLIFNLLLKSFLANRRI